MAAKITIHVEMEDGREFDVSADQRDFAAWEMQPFYDDDRKVTRTRYLAFSASSRAKHIDLSWPRFNAACVTAHTTDDEPVTVDPTEPDQSGAP